MAWMRGLVWALGVMLAGGAAQADVPKPLLDLCRMICGGVWVAGEGAEAGFLRFEYEERYGLIRGRSGPLADKPQLPSDSLTIYGYDHGAKKIWSLQAGFSSAPLGIGGVTLNDDGFTDVLDLGIVASTRVYTFDGPDKFVMTSVTASEGGISRYDPVTFTRRKE